MGYLAFLKNRWLFSLSPPDAPERPRTPPDAPGRHPTAANRCQSLPLAATRSEWVRIAALRPVHKKLLKSAYFPHIIGLHGWGNTNGYSILQASRKSYSRDGQDDKAAYTNGNREDTGGRYKAVTRVSRLVPAACRRLAHPVFFPCVRCAVDRKDRSAW